MTSPEVQALRCVRYRYRYSNCSRCVESCSHDAITASDEGVAIDAGKCRGCTLCTAACPTGALTSTALRRIDLLKEAIRHKVYSIACQPSGLAADVRIPCLGALDGAMLAYLAKRGIGVDLRGAGHCDDCEHGASGAALLAAHLEARKALEQACAGETWAPTHAAGNDAGRADDDFRPNRRHLFRRLVARGVDQVVRATEPPPEAAVVDKAIRPGPWFTPEMRELLHIVAKRPDGAACTVPAMPALPLAELGLVRGCTQCTACLRACPTGAIRVRETDDQWSMLFVPDHCVGCSVCLEVCQPQVLRKAPAIDAAPGRKPVALNILAKQRCNRCDRHFVSSEPAGTCPVCADDDDAFGRIFG